MENRTGNPRPRVLSGMRPTGKLHLGNYVGALQNWVKLQHTHECFFFVADWHALTTDYDDTSRVADNTLEVVLDWLSAGLDPEKCTMSVQSHVLQHAELHVLFSMITPLGWLERVPSYKEQQQNLQGKDLLTYGFLGYPVLQAADILVYRPDFVPVGEDQVAHVELTREIARRFNQFFSRPSAGKVPVIKEPQALLTAIPKLLGTDGRKMSKSYGNSILLSDDAATVEEKIKNSVTDRPKLTDRGSPDRCPVGNLHQVFSDAARLAHITNGCTQATIKCIDCKALAVESVNAQLEPMRQRRRQFSEEPDRLAKIIREGNRKAREETEQTMAAARKAVGLLSQTTLKSPAAEAIPALEHPDSRPALPKLSPGELQGMNHTQRGDRRRDVWLEYITRTYPLRDVGHRTFVTGKNRRVGIPTSGEDQGHRWNFSIGDRTYEVLVLLCHRASGEIIDFVIPRTALKDWKSFKRDGKNVHFDVHEKNGSFVLNEGLESAQEITSFKNNHKALE